jgi:hypothetical protein
MKRIRSAVAAGLLLLLLCSAPTAAQKRPTLVGPVTAESLQKLDDSSEKEAKEKEAREKARKAEEAKVEAEKRKQAEWQKQREAAEIRAKEDNAREEPERRNQEPWKLERRQQQRKDEDRRGGDARKQEEDRKEYERKLELRRRDELRRKEWEARLEAEKRERVRRREERERYHYYYGPYYGPYRDGYYGYNGPYYGDYYHGLDPYYPGASPYYYPPAPQPNDGDVTTVLTPSGMSDSVPTGGGVESSDSTAPPGQASGAPVGEEVVASSTPPPVTVSAPRTGAAESGIEAAQAPSPDTYRRPYREPEPLRSYVGVVFAPGSGDRKSAVGIQFISSRNFGLGVWLSGSLGRDDDVIDATIPHDDYYTESRHGTYGFEALFGVGSDAAMLVFGAGVSVEQTLYTDVSNATGWKWNGGESSEVKPAAQIGARFRLGGRVSMHLGYDTAQSGFFGLSAAF